NGVEPVSLIEMRLQVKAKGGPRLVPHAVVVAGNHSECIVSGGNVRVVSDPAGPCRNPVSVKTFELVFELDLVGRNKAQAGVVKRKAAAAGRELGPPGRIDSLVVHKHPVDRDRGRQRIGPDLLRINHGDTLKGRKPQSAVAGPPACRMSSAGT